jgi:hypothetical protein
LHGNAWKKDAKANQYTCCREMDNALALMDDLASIKGDDGRTLLETTFVVCMGEFGRTPGPLNPRGAVITIVMRTQACSPEPGC